MIWLKEGFRLLGQSGLRAILLMIVTTMLMLLARVTEWAWLNSSDLRRAWQENLIVELYLTVNADVEVIEERVGIGRAFAWEGLLNESTAAEEFEAGFGLNIVELLGHNPFPRTVRLSLKPEGSRDTWEAELDALSHLPGVESVYADPLLLRAGGRGLRFALGGSILILLLLLGLSLVVLRALGRSIERRWRDTALLLDLQGCQPLLARVPPAIAICLPTVLAALVSLLIPGSLVSVLELPAYEGLLPLSLLLGLAPLLLLLRLLLVDPHDDRGRPKGPSRRGSIRANRK